MFSARMLYEFLEKFVARINSCRFQQRKPTPPPAIAANPHLRTVLPGFHQVSGECHPASVRRSGLKSSSANLFPPPIRFRREAVQTGSDQTLFKGPLGSQLGSDLVHHHPFAQDLASRDPYRPLPLFGLLRTHAQLNHSTLNMDGADRDHNAGPTRESKGIDRGNASI